MLSGRGGRKRGSPIRSNNEVIHLMRVALRGTATLRPLLAPRADEIVAWCSTILRETRAHYLKIQFRACYTVCSFAYCLDRPELARAAAEWLR